MQNSKYIILFLAGLLLFSPYWVVVVNASNAKEYYPVSDSFVSSIESEIHSNFGGQSYLSVANSDNMFVGVKEIYLKFNLNSIPSDSIIESARLYMYSSIVSETHRIGVYYCPDDEWIEYEISWSNKPSIVGEVVDSVLVAKNDELYSWDVKSIVSSIIPSKQSLTLVLRSEDFSDSSWLWFHSRDQDYSWMEKYRPMLKVTYDKPPSQPQTEDTSNNQESYIPETESDYTLASQIFAIFIVLGLFTLIFIAITYIRRSRKKSNTLAT
jgi:hypothetical protein